METIGLKIIYVPFFVELGTRRIRTVDCTTNPNTVWVTQQARQLVWELEDESQKMAFLIRDNDKKFPSAFDAVFDSKGIEIVRTPYRAPQAYAFVERWVRSVREECLDQVLIVNQRHCAVFLANTPIITIGHGRIRASGSVFPIPVGRGVQ